MQRAPCLVHTSAAINSSFGSFTLRNCSLRKSEQHTDGSKPPEKLWCRTSNNETKARKAVIKEKTVSFRNYLYFLLCTWTKQHWHGTETMQDKSKIILQILKYRSDPQFKDVSTLVFRDKSSSEAGESVTAGPHSTAGSSSLAAAAWGNGDAQEVFPTEATPAVPPVPNPGHSNIVWYLIPPPIVWCLIPAADLSLRISSWSTKEHRVLWRVSLPWSERLNPGVMMPKDVNLKSS